MHARGLLVAAFLLAAIAGCAAPATHRRMVGPTGRIYADPEPDVPGIARFAYLNAHVARGGQPTAEGVRWLESKGFRTIISFSPRASEQDQAKALGLRYVAIPVQANLLGSAPPTDAQLDTFFAVVNDSAQWPVFFHCHHGADRTGMFCALYRIEVDGWTHEEAIGEMQAFGYNDFFRDLVHVVQKYEPRGAAADSVR
jgi:tyrosine-protein phosphatase SIW14